MRILPEDLGEKWEAIFVRQRAVPAQGTQAHTRALANKRQLGVFGRLWTRGLGLSRERAGTLTAATGDPLAAVTILGCIVAFMASILAFSFGVKTHLAPEQTLSLMAGCWAFIGTLGVVGQRTLFKKFLLQPLNAEEVDEMLEGCTEEIDRAFLGLARDAVRQSAPPETEANLRAALGALEAAIRRLPTVQVSALDAPTLRAEAVGLLKQAQREPDRVTAESMERRARAIEHRVAANEQSALLARRSTALREEIVAQMEALREGVAALSTHAPDYSVLAYLAQTARQVASEAGELASAREELDGALIGLPHSQPVEERVQVRAS